MTGRGHKLAGAGAGASLAYLFLADGIAPAALSFVFCMWGSTAPDWLEVRIGKGRTLIPHRTLTHWPWPWVLLVVVVMATVGEPLISAALIGFLVGGLTHLCGDAITPDGIPLLASPMRKVSIASVQSGGLQELMWVASVWCGMLLTCSVPTLRLGNG